jgi:hypothetical protein
MKGRFHGPFVCVAGRFELGRFVCYSCSSKQSFAVVVDYSLSRMVVVTACVGVCGKFLSSY